VGNCETGTSEPLTTLRARDGIPDWREIGKLLEEWQPGLIVVGQPLNMDGSDSELSRRAAKFGRRLEGRYGLPVEQVDERLSSFEAKQQLREAGHSGDYRKNPADDLAAQIILQSYLSR
jgi:putative Holliday junction resolvase